MKKGTEIIKNKIQAINPSVTDELLDLLYEYINEKRYEKDQECMHNEEAFKSAQRALKEFQMKRNSLILTQIGCD